MAEHAVVENLDVVGTADIARQAGVSRVLVTYFAVDRAIPFQRVGQAYLFRREDGNRLVELLRDLDRRINVQRKK